MSKKTEKSPSKKKHPGGRPTKYKPEYCDTIIAMGKQGKSRVQCATALDVHTDTLYEWADKHTEFSDAMKKAKEFAEAFWETRLMVMMESGELIQASPTFMFYMKCRFGWRDKDATTINLETKTKGEAVFNFNSVADSDFNPDENDGKK